MNIVDILLKIALLGSAWVLYLLIFLSIASVGVMSERALFFVRNRRGGGPPLREALLQALRSNDPDAADRLLRASGTIEGRIVSAAMASNPAEMMARQAPGGSIVAQSFHLSS